jgi:transposase
MLPYSLDLRERVVGAYQEGLETIEEIAERFAVGQTFVKKMLRQKRETGSLEIKKPRSGAKKLLSKKDFKWLRRQIEKEPDLTIDQLHERIGKERNLNAAGRLSDDVCKSWIYRSKKEPIGAGKKQPQTSLVLASRPSVDAIKTEVFRRMRSQSRNDQTLWQSRQRCQSS